ncbi:MAG: ABC transporter substrate-binding protein [Bifidobacteriaceae bacterium]|jgi:peptide/nickel transport system substrate-binding protein|nr:ABC transporter substrate-binding protein [Bifidobacteriaceae bacterium]
MKDITKKALRIAITGFCAVALTVGVSACGGTKDGADGGAGDASLIKIGTIDKITSLDPAGSYDNGSFTTQIQVFPMLFNYDHDAKAIVPDVAESGTFTSPDVYTVKLKSGLKWADDSPLTAEDVKFTFDRVKAIDDPNGPASLLENLETVTVVDETTVEFKLANENDVVFESVLSSPAGPLVPKAHFDADKLTDPDTIVNAKAFGGQYIIKTFKLNELIEMEANPNYGGLWGAPTTQQIQVQYLSDASNLKLGIQNGDLDVAYRSLPAVDIEDLRKDENVEVVLGPGGEERYIVFNLDLQPYGAKTDTPDAAKALAVRQAIAHTVNRTEIAESVYKNTYTPIYSVVPEGFQGATTPLKELYGDGNGGPDVDKAKKVLEDAEIEYPVTLKLQYNGDHYGTSSGDEYALIKSQLEGSGLFNVDLQQTEWVSYNKARLDSYPAYQLGWFPDYPDADNYLSPFFVENGFLHNNYSNKTVQDLIVKEQTDTDETSRLATIGELQTAVAKDLPTLPLLQGAQIAIVRKGVTGADRTLDPSFKFTYGFLAKN